MNKTLALLLITVTGVLAAPKPGKIAIINLQGAIAATQEGKKASEVFEAKISTRRVALKGKLEAIQKLQAQIREPKLDENARARLERNIDALSNNLNNESNDLGADIGQITGEITNTIGTKMMAIIERYAAKNGLALIIDVANDRNQVLWANKAINLTPEIIRLYDSEYPVK